MPAGAILRGVAGVSCGSLPAAGADVALPWLVASAIIAASFA